MNNDLLEANTDLLELFKHATMAGNLYNLEFMQYGDIKKIFSDLVDRLPLEKVERSIEFFERENAVGWIFDDMKRVLLNRKQQLCYLSKVGCQ